jgi:hypothetical protein
MSDKDKKLLLIDLSARLPYRQFVLLGGKETVMLCGIDGDEVYLNIDSDSFHVESIKPYLRPMSSMTRDESYELDHVEERYDNHYDSIVAQIDWLNKHHFDYRGLIEKGLALEAPKGMYGTDLHNN